jgi:hypothetical protein
LPSRWDIVPHPGGLDVWPAEHQSPGGRHVRYIVALSPGELAAKLETADVVEP